MARRRRERVMGKFYGGSPGDFGRPALRGLTPGPSPRVERGDSSKSIPLKLGKKACRRLPSPREWRGAGGEGRTPRGQGCTGPSPSVRHVLLLQPEMVPQLVDHGVADLADHLPAVVAGAEDGAAVDEDAVRQGSL